MERTAVILGALGVLTLGLTAGDKPTVADALKNVRVLAVPENGRPVTRTVAEELRRDLAPQADIKVLRPGNVGGPGVFRISVADERIAAGPPPEALRKAEGKSWMYVRLEQDGSGELTSSASHLLFA